MKLSTRTRLKEIRNKARGDIELSKRHAPPDLHFDFVLEMAGLGLASSQDVSEALPDEVLDKLKETYTTMRYPFKDQAFAKQAGAKGGKIPTSKPKGFAANPEKARLAGKKSKRKAAK